MTDETSMMPLIRPPLMLLFIAALAFSAVAHAQRQMEALGRGVVALNQGGGNVYVSWRLLGTDSDELAFNVYRATGAAGDAPGATAPVRLNPAPLTQTTDFVDTGADTTRALFYHVRPVLRGSELMGDMPFVLPANAPVRPYLAVPLTPPPDGSAPDGSSYSYTANDASAADLDGDGEYELILKWDPTNSKDNSQSGHTGQVYLDGYKLDGTRLWRINLGQNIRAGAHYTQFIAYDLDGDGRAEIACKTADGTSDGTGRVIGNPAADFRNSSGYVLRGPEYLTVFDGRTGAALATTNYVPARNSDPASGDVTAWGDNYGNRVDRFLAGVAYLDGARPSLLMCRGYYTRTAVVAWDWRDGRLTQRWRFDTRSDTAPAAPAAGFADWEEMGNHSLSIADVDDDGRDEIVFGAIVIDDDGRGLYTTGRGHGDALHVSDMDPDRPGLEVYSPHETQRLYGNYAAEMRDARTGEPLWGIGANLGDVGRGVAFDIDPRHRGYEAWASRGGLYSAKGELISTARPSQMNFGVWWDADPLRELLDGTTISKWDWTTSRSVTLLSASGSASNNGTKATPCLSADLLGDWREEIVWRSADNRELRIYTTTIPAATRLPTLMHEPQYRVAIAWQNVGYNQPPHPGFYLGDGMTRPPTRLIRPVGATVTPRPATNRLVNLSVRAAAGGPSGPLILGFAVAGGGRQPLLLRSVGPTLEQFGVAGAMRDPRLSVQDGALVLAANDDWAASSPEAEMLVQMSASVGAFPLPRPSRDSALIRSFTAGALTVHVSDAAGVRGVVLAEAYAGDTAEPAHLINLSARGFAGREAETLTAGFVIRGMSARPVLIRAIGPGLGQFGVGDAIADPQLTLYRGGVVLDSNDDWQVNSGAAAAEFALIGAFALAHGSKDAALLLNLPPGAYTAEVTGAAGRSGSALIEIYVPDL